MAAFATSCIFALHGQGQEVPSPAPQPEGQLSFHNPTPTINDGPGSLQPVSPAMAGESQQEMDDLASQKQTLDSELLYAHSKLDAARKRLDVETMAGHSDEADKWEQEVRDWQGRVKDLESQSGQVNSEMQGAVQSLQPAAPEDTLILPGDILEIFVVEDPSFNGRYQVRRGGYIILPAVGRIMVAGKTFSGAEIEVRKALEATQLQHATVMVEKVEGSDIESGPVIFLAGEFRNDRPFRIPPGTKATVVNVILSCGGVTDKADLTRVKVMRVVANKSVVEEVNVQKILEGSGLTSDLTLNDGDVLTIPAGAANVVYVTGRVVRPGEQSLHPGDKLTVFSAILNAGGFARYADLKKVYVLRASPDGTKVRIPVNVIAIQHGHAPDLLLLGNDILIVPEKFFSF
jgi:protein involved in polysaccharide export with SLBB domain